MLTLALPVVVTDPNKGATSGLMPVAVLQEGARITNIFAPDVTYNPIDGVGTVFRMLRYFSADSSLLIDAGSSTEGYNQYLVQFNQERIGPKRFLFYEAQFKYDTDLSARFYGLGNDSEDRSESSYVFRRTLSGASLGIRLPLNMAAQFREQIVSYKVGPGRLEDVPSSRLVHKDVFGVDSTDPGGYFPREFRL